MASGVAALNAVQSRQTIRLFWLFLAGAFGLWALVPCSWFYSVVLHGKIPTFLFDNPPLFLHIVLMIAAVASRPHLRLPSQAVSGHLRLSRLTFRLGLCLHLPPVSLPVWVSGIGHDLAL
jgi:hypothetical protein